MVLELEGSAGAGAGSTSAVRPDVVQHAPTAQKRSIDDVVMTGATQPAAANDDVNKSGRKRKRKRPAAKAKHSAFEDSGEEDNDDVDDNNQPVKSTATTTSSHAVPVSAAVPAVKKVDIPAPVVVIAKSTQEKKPMTSSHLSNSHQQVRSNQSASTVSVDHKKISELKSGKLLSSSRLQEEIKRLESEKKKV